MKFIINGKLIDFSNNEVQQGSEKKPSGNISKNGNEKKVTDEHKEFLERVTKFNKAGKKATN